MATKPTRKQVEACDLFAEALVTITRAARLDEAGKFNHDDLAAIAAKLAQASPAFGLEAIAARAMERRGRSLGLSTTTVELIGLLEGVQPLETLLLTDDAFRELVDRMNEELGDP